MKTTRVKADPWNPGKSPKGSGLWGWRVHPIVADSLEAALSTIRHYGGIVPSAGGLRALDAPVTAGRALYSLHCLGLAVDLHTACDRLYAVTYDSTGTHRHTLYIERPDGTPLPMPRVRWRKLKSGRWEMLEAVEEPRVVANPSLTDIFHLYCWTPIGPRSNKAGAIVCPEFWHFNHCESLQKGESFFDAAVRHGLSPADIDRHRPKAKQVRWNGSSFA